MERVTQTNVGNALYALRNLSGILGRVESAGPCGWNLYLDAERQDLATGVTLRQVRDYVNIYAEGFRAGKEFDGYEEE